jgi:transposase
LIRGSPPFAGASSSSLPEYSPDLNRIEQVFAKLKHPLRKAATRSFAAVTAAIGAILDSFTPRDCRNYFANSGYQQS